MTGVRFPAFVTLSERIPKPKFHSRVSFGSPRSEAYLTSPRQKRKVPGIGPLYQQLSPRSALSNAILKSLTEDERRTTAGHEIGISCHTENSASKIPLVINAKGPSTILVEGVVGGDVPIERTNKISLGSQALSVCDTFKPSSSIADRHYIGTTDPLSPKKGGSNVNVSAVSKDLAGTSLQSSATNKDKMGLSEYVAPLAHEWWQRIVDGDSGSANRVPWGAVSTS